MAEAKRDQNHVTTALFVSTTDDVTPLNGRIVEATGRILVDSSGASSVLTMETPTGTVNASNNVFTVTHTPLFINVDNRILPLVTTITDIDGNGFTYSAGTVTVSALTPPVSFIRSYYNS